MDSAIARSVARNRASLEGRRPGVKPLRSRTFPHVAALYGTLARNFPDGSLVLFDHDLRYIMAGVDLGDVAGLAPPGCEGKAVRDVLPPETAQALEPLYRGALAGRRAAAEVTYQDRWLLVRAGPVRDEQGTIVAGMSLSLDITDAKQAEEALRGSRDHRMESVARLAGGIAHDFNNLLTVVLGSAEILLDDLPRAYARRSDLEEIKTAATQAAQLTRQVLAYSRQQVLAPRPLNLNSLVGGMERALRPLLGARIELRLDLAAPSGAVRVDPAQLEQAVLNLVMNARDAMPGGGRLEVVTRTVMVDEAFAREHPPMRPGRYATLAVRDSGVGMDDETQRHLFEPFFTTKPGRHGAGLGLATTYGIVKQSGGFIWTESAPGAGATFTIYLPWHELVAAAAPAAESTGTPRGAGETVLVVDDEPAVRVVTKRILQRSGYAVLDAPGGVEALDTLREHPGPIHLLLTDVIMPEMNGREVAQRVREQRPGIRVVYMSAYSPEAIAHDGLLDAGAAFVRKPFESGMLLQTVRRALDTEERTATPA